MSKRIKAGDVFEIETKRGLAYGQFVLKDKQWGALIRVLYGLHRERPSEFASIVSGKHRFVTFFPLQYAVNKGIVSVVAKEKVPEEADGYPLFREAGMIDRSGKVLDWWLWDGKSSQRIGRQLPERYRSLPILEVWNDTLLRERIEEDWSPELFV